MNNRYRSAFRRFVADSSLTAILFSLAVIIAACSSTKPAEGTSVTLSNGETAGVIVTMDPNESTTPAPPSESVSGTASSGDDVIAAPTVPKSGSSYSFRYQNILIMPGSDAVAALGSITEDPEIADSMEADKKGVEVSVRSYTFSNFVIYARLDSEGRYIIARIILSSKDSVTPEGIGIGASADEVLKTYGTQYTDNGNSITYTSGTTDLIFFFADGKVSDIVYNYNKFT
ncbi:MAG: hypothetical protein IKH06_08360 [Clostridiales bacterium]|nr:hypothetical protein [Clostridiales bacterium]